MIRPSALLFACSSTLLASAISVEVTVMRHSYCGRASGLAVAFVSGGTPPISYQWSTGATDGAQLIGLLPGLHSVTVTDALGESATADFTVELLSEYGFFGQFSTSARCPENAPMAQVFPVLLDYDPTVSFGPPPYTYSSPEIDYPFTSGTCDTPTIPAYDHLVFSETAAGMVTVDFTDGIGCPGYIEVHIDEPWPDLPVVQPLNVLGSCASTATGAITFSHEGSLDHEYLVLLRPSDVQDECAPQVRTELIGTNAPAGTRVFNNLSPGTYWLITSTDAYRALSGTPWGDNACKDSVQVLVPSLGTDCGVLSGRVYIDDAPDCILGGAENRVPGTIVEITPGPYYVTTNSSGQYAIGLNFGTYTVTEQHPVFEQSCPGAVSLSAGSQTFNVGCAGGEPLDLDLDIGNGPARPGFELLYGLSVQNLTPASTGEVTLTVSLDPALGFVNANPTPTSVVGHVLTWTGPQLELNQVFQERSVSIRTSVPADVALIGTTLTTTAQLSSANTDGHLSNNTAVSAQLVTGSYDPNDKRATTSTGHTAALIIDADEWIDYTIRFQNTGTDTAFNVVITDTLPTTLDPGSIEWGVASHPHARQLLGQGVLKFIFPNILLPDSNVNEPLSHGFVTFRVKPRLPVAPGTVIENIANIYFDFNPPVITEPSVLVAEFSTGLVGAPDHPATLFVYPNPVLDAVNILVDGAALERIVLAALDGRVVADVPCSGTRVSLDIEGITAGSYMLVVHNREGRTLRTSLVKQ
ncbi:MAG: DUF7619 domain-containing protein [Flavobacteriales bacterium]